jgi:PhnB protein
MTTVNPYLTFNGNCEEAFNFYKSVFRSEFQFIGRYKDVPPPDRQIFAPENDEKIMHISLPISKETSLMGCDNAELYKQAIAFNRAISLSIEADNTSEADRIFSKLSEGGKIQMPMNKTFWGSYFGMVQDKFGVHWMISCSEIEK